MASNWGALPASSHDRTRPPPWRWECLSLGRDHHDREDRTPHLPGECHWALLQRQPLLAYCCALRPSAWECIHFSRRQRMSPSYTLSNVTCSFAESRLSQGQRSPQTCFQLGLRGTSPGDVSKHGITSHMTSPSSLMHFRTNGATTGRLIRSMRRRCLACLVANRGPSRY